ncbi:hypothetical protein D0Z07_9181 [Hyphodiscus hymeniophilus]|uniref:DUF1989 domain-containing protein n=1 Tax=Hyphodiscus hymeniophilus TaxID=353542 RepID=A0A9P6SK52_9HELO|nr:hypothetical protein D0Z07_9181 [Hyphodiscus hymeniophilus]
MAPTIIPARHGLAISLKMGQTLKIVNTHGTQVIDTWAFTVSGSKIISQRTLSLSHTRASLQRTIPLVGDSLYSNERKKMLTVTEDTSGVHDTLIAACDRWRYAELGVEGALEGSHRNCTDNLGEGLEAVGAHLFLLYHSSSSLDCGVQCVARLRNERIEKPQFAPQPLNLFMNIPIHENRTSLSFEAPTGKKGEYICLKAELDLVVAVSACPQDILKINGGECKDAGYEII